MNRILLSVCTVILGITIIISNVQVSDSVLSDKMLVTVKAEKDPITEGAFPVILGTVKDQGYKPVPNANVLITFGTNSYSN